MVMISIQQTLVIYSNPLLEDSLEKLRSKTLTGTPRAMMQRIRPAVIVSKGHSFRSHLRAKTQSLSLWYLEIT